MTITVGQVNRFRVWREYHRLQVELDRIPTCQEIADEVGLTYAPVWNHLNSLGLETRRQGCNARYEDRDPIDPFDEHEPDLIELLGIEDD